MVQVLQPREKGPSFAQKVASGLVQGGMQEYDKYQALKQQNQQMQRENESAKKLGVDLSGITDPQTRQKLLVESLKGQQKNQLMGQKQDFLGKLFNNGPQENQQSPDQGMQSVNQGFDPSNVSDEDIARATAMDPTLGRELRAAKDASLEQRRHEENKTQKNLETERTFQTGYSKKYVEKADKIRDSLPRQQQALNYARDAIETGEVGAFSVNALADSIGGVVGDALRNKSGTQLTLAAKEQLLPTLSRISAKAQNQYMEKRISSMIPKAGQSMEANLTMQEMLEAESAMDQAYLSEFDRLSEEDNKTFGYERKDIDKRVHSAIKPLEKHIMQRTNFRLRELEEQEKGLNEMKKSIGKNVVKGTPLTMAMAKLYNDKFGKEALAVAEKNGYYIPTPDEFMSYQKRPEEFREGF